MAKIEIDGASSVEVVDEKASTEYCLRYMIHNDYASKMVISSNFIPKTLSIILTANLYSGGSCDLETSTLAGSIQIKVYRFMLNGNQDFSMTATGVPPRVPVPLFATRCPRLELRQCPYL